MTEGRMAARLIQPLAGQWRVLVGVLPGVALAMIHSTMLDIPRADVVAALDSDRYRVQWIMGSYLLGSAAGMALTGFLGGRLGLRRSYLLAAALFTLAAAACGLVSEVIWMTPLRLVQGVSMGLLISSGMVILWRAFPGHKELAMVAYGTGVYLAALLGPVCGGLLVAWSSWRLLFLINLPLGCAVTAVAWWTLPSDDPARAAHGRFDVVGFTLHLLWIGTLIVVLDMGQYWGWLTSPYFVPWLAALVLSFTCFVCWGIWSADPLINLRPLALRSFGLGLCGKALLSINLDILVGLLAAYMINLRGYQWWQGSLVILPGFLAMLAALVVGTCWGTDANRKARMFAGTATMACATWLISSVDVYTAKGWLSLHLALWGAGAGLTIGPIMFTVFEGMTPVQMLRCAGIFNTMRALPTFIVGSILITLLTQRSDDYFDNLRQRITYNRPIVALTTTHQERHFTARGSGPEQRVKQARAALGLWVHANARAYALQTVLKYLALLTAVGPVLVLFIRGPERAATAQVGSGVGNIDAHGNGG